MRRLLATIIQDADLKFSSVLIFINRMHDALKEVEPTVSSDLKERLRSLEAPVEILMTKELKDYLEASFVPFFERAFQLFEKNGLIAKAVESTLPNSPKSFGFSRQQIMETVDIMKQAGYNYVGTYHHHLDSDLQVVLRKSPPAEKESYKLPQSYDPVQMSPDDRGVFNSIGFSIGQQEQPEIQEIMSGIKYLFLGHHSESKGYRLKSYTVLDKLPQNHPWNQFRRELGAADYLENHYRGFNDILTHPIEIITTGDTDPQAKEILDQAGAKNRKLEVEFDNDYGKGKLRIFIDKGKIAFVEILTEDQARRYWFNSESQIEKAVVYGDNRTRTVKVNIDHLNGDELTEEMNRFYSQFDTIFKSISGIEL